MVDLPEWWKPFGMKFNGTHPELEDAVLQSAKRSGKAMASKENVSAPKLTYQVDPQFTPAARQQGFSGTSLIGMVIDENGIPVHMHVVEPLGLGLDEAAVAAVREYRMCCGKMVGERGFEPPTPWSRTRCSTRLSHSPTS